MQFLGLRIVQVISKTFQIFSLSFDCNFIFHLLLLQLLLCRVAAIKSLPKHQLQYSVLSISSFEINENIIRFL